MAKRRVKKSVKKEVERNPGKRIVVKDVVDRYDGKGRRPGYVPTDSGNDPFVYGDSVKSV